VPAVSLEGTISLTVMRECIAEGRVPTKPELEERVTRLVVKVYDPKERRNESVTSPDELSIKMSPKHLEELAMIAFGKTEAPKGAAAVPAQESAVRA